MTSKATSAGEAVAHVPPIASAFGHHAFCARLCSRLPLHSARVATTIAFLPSPGVTPFTPATHCWPETVWIAEWNSASARGPIYTLQNSCHRPVPKLCKDSCHASEQRDTHLVPAPGEASASVVRMRIGIRVQIAVLVLSASLIGLAVLTLATWVWPLAQSLDRC